MAVLHDAVSAEVVGDYTVRITFDDGTVGDVNLQDLKDRSGVFEPLKDPAFFARLRVDPELGTIVWPNGADLDPCALYDEVTASRPAQAI